MDEDDSASSNQGVAADDAARTASGKELGATYINEALFRVSARGFKCAAEPR